MGYFQYFDVFICFMFNGVVFVFWGVLFCCDLTLWGFGEMIAMISIGVISFFLFSLLVYTIDFIFLW
jgi:hypothetical protein